MIGKGSDDPATRYRILPLKRRLQEYGHEVCLWDNHGRSVQLLKRAAAADITFVQRRLPSRLLTWALRRLYGKLIFDGAGRGSRCCQRQIYPDRG